MKEEKPCSASRRKHDFVFSLRVSFRNAVSAEKHGDIFLCDRVFLHFLFGLAVLLIRRLFAGKDLVIFRRKLFEFRDLPVRQFIENLLRRLVDRDLLTVRSRPV